MTDPDRDDDLILAAAAMFQAAAMQQLGKLVNPSSGEAEADLEQARFTIDVLGALFNKTEGRLHDRARRELEHMLFQLRMNYLEEARRRQPAQDTSTTPPSPETGPAEEAPRDEGTREDGAGGEPTAS